MHLEYVEFYDHWSDDAWQDIEGDHDDADCMRCISVGFLLAENKRCIRLVANIDGEPDAADHGFATFTILKSAIIRRRRLNVPK